MACPYIGKNAAHRTHTCINCARLETNLHYISDPCYACYVTKTKCNFLPSKDFKREHGKHGLR